MRTHDVKPGIPGPGFRLAVLLTALLCSFLASFTYFTVQDRLLRRQIEYGRYQLQQADGIMRYGPHLLDEMRSIARTNDVIRGILRANEYPLESMPSGGGT